MSYEARCYRASLFLCVSFPFVLRHDGDYVEKNHDLHLEQTREVALKLPETEAGE